MNKTQEIMKKVRAIELRARRLATTSFAGQYRSGFRGSGLDFDDFREYTAGDDPRLIDWKVTARTGTMYIKRFLEAREQVILIAVDVSASMRFAGAQSSESKLEYAALIAAVLAYSAARNNDHVGLLLYGCDNHFYLPPDKGGKQCLRIIREILGAPPAGKDEPISTIAAEVLRTQRKRAVVFLISDYLAKPDEASLGKLNFRHELIPVRINDPMELELPAGGKILFRDPETGEQFQAELTEKTREQHARAMYQHRQEWEQVFHRMGTDVVDLLTDGDFIAPLRMLFDHRSKIITH